MIRLDRLLSNLGYASRSEVSDLIDTGEVLINGKPAKSGSQRVAHNDVTIYGEALDPAEGVCLMLNKPCGYTCSYRDSGALVYELLPERFQRRKPQISTVGRLDKETSGLLLLTDDGDLLHRLTKPKSNIPKVYEVVLARALRGDEAEIFAGGTLMLENETEPLLPAKLESVSELSVRLTIYEGRYHQVRRMFAACGNHVEQLHRARIGGLELGNLESGKYLILTKSQISAALASNHQSS